jgi:uncharacterized membrane protein YdjX (TVP38/TMEM64 family)
MNLLNNRWYLLKYLLTCFSIVLLIGLLFLSYQREGILYIIFNSDLSAADRIESIRDYFLAFGALAPFLYIAFVMIEVVVAPLPGLMLYAPGGMIFGGFLGGLLSLIGNIIGAGIAHQIVRIFGQSYVETFLENKSLNDYNSRISDNGIWVVFILRVNPFTSSDLVSYAAGLTRMKVWKLMLGTMLGMAPLCWIQAYFADGLLKAFPQLIYPLIVACVIYVIVIIWIIKNVFNNKKG